MIDLRLLLDDFEATAARLGRKKVPRALVTEARDLVLRRRADVQAVDEARTEMNAGAAKVGQLMREGRRDEAETMKADLAAARGRIDELEATLRVTEAELDDVAMRLPNLPDDAAPDGDSEEDNVVVRVEGYDPADYQGRTY
ncbi:MAG: hypothetical protein J2O47_02340, partial [Acidimicrobiaceae bacterium]|nr:hypothetical protein [Acidimicrobiaceae bacterium]